MARLEGFEPPTNRFEADYSIQLSYRRSILNDLRTLLTEGLFRASCPTPLRGYRRDASMFKYVPDAFVEPPTNRFEADYSIQLSYRRSVQRWEYTRMRLKCQ